MRKDLRAREVAQLKPGLWRASKSLYAQVSESGGRSWVYRYMVKGRARQMGIGSCDVVTLAEAREKVIDLRRQLAAGIDPIEHRKATAEPTIERTLEYVTRLYHGAHKAEWGNERFQRQWLTDLERHIFPAIGRMPIYEIKTGDVFQALKPVWTLKSAPLWRGRIEAVWNSAKPLGWVSGDNPAQWKGNLQPLLSDVRADQKHQPALSWRQMSAFMAHLRADPTLTARALEVTILTVLRAGAVLPARWGEFDLILGMWVVPACRMKGKKGKRVDFRVPLSARVLEILRALPSYAERTPDALVFAADGKPIAANAMLNLLGRFRLKDTTGEPIVVHGFRSSFRDWAEEETTYSRTAIELAMQHKFGGKVETSYRRGDVFGQRMALMEDWSSYCMGQTVNPTEMAD
jgi:integrase